MESFEQLYSLYFKRVYAYVLLRTGDDALAEDLCAQTWRKAYEKLESYDGRKGAFGQWLFGIARNEINMHRRLGWVKRLFSMTEAEEYLPSEEASPVQAAEARELKERLLEALRTLPAKERDLLSLKFYSGLNNRQIAAVTDLSESNVGTIAHRAVQRLRRHMEEA